MSINIKLIAGLILTAVLGGCQSVTYYSQAVGGHLNIWSQQRDIEVLLADPDSDPRLRARLETALEARRFATDQLNLPDNGSYTRYADLERDFVVWNVVAAPPYSIEPLKSCFPVVGCVAYRGYYDKEDAETWAEQQRQAGMDVYVGGVAAYSTLGWFDDPLLNTMLYQSDAAIAALIFHELAHQRVYVQDDTRFNESFATAVEEIGLESWVLTRVEREHVNDYLSLRARQAAVIELLLEARQNLEEAYKLNADAGKDRLEKIKRAEFKRLRGQYTALKDGGGGTPGFDRFFESELNNASLALFGAYHGWVNAFKQLYAESNDNWQTFYTSVSKLSELPRGERDRLLAAYSVNE